MKLIKTAGVTAEIWQIFIQDASSTTGDGLAGLTNASSGLTAYYHRDTDTTATAISLVSMTVGTFTSEGFKEIDATNMPGWYQFCPPNAALAAGAKSCAIHLKGATNMAPLPIEVQLDVVPANLKQIDEQATNGNNATLNLKQLSVINNAGTAIIATSTGGNGKGIAATGEGSGHGIQAVGGGTDANGIHAVGGLTNGNGLVLVGRNNGAGLWAVGGDTGIGLHAVGGGTSGDAIKADATGSGLDINANNSDIGGVALSAAGVTAVGTGVWASGTRTLTSFGTLVADVATAVWGAATRVLTAGTNIVLAKGVGLIGLNDLSQADVRSAVGLAAANLDTQLATLATLIDGTATPAEVATEIATALATTTYGAPTGVPGNTVALAEKIGRIYQVLIDGLVVDSNTGEIRFKNAAGTVLWKKTFTDVGDVYTESGKTAP